MQFETIEPSHRAFASLSYAIKSLVLEDALVLAYSQRNAVNETNSCAFAHQNSLDENDKLNNRPFLQLHEAVVG